MSVFGMVAALLGAVLITGVAATLLTRRRDMRRVSYMMDALEDGELNFRFRENNRFNKALNRILYIFEKQRRQHEQDSWMKLIRVLTHEIMNTVSPIASLSEALVESMDAERTEEIDLREALGTIADSSKDLIKFVQTYRELSGVERPHRARVDLRTLVERTISLNSEALASCGAECRYLSGGRKIEIFADEEQVSRIFINLIKNALQAGARELTVSAELREDDEVTVRFANDGEPIPRQVQEQIFMPFFTTKPEGSGIGLSLARQIMGRHNGSIDLERSDAGSTVFVLRFR